MEVGDVDAHGLLAHSRLVRVPWRLVVVRKWDNGCTHTCEDDKINNTSPNKEVNVLYLEQ